MREATLLVERRREQVLEACRNAEGAYPDMLCQFRCRCDM
jgi:hypothetical protein